LKIYIITNAVKMNVKCLEGPVSYFILSVNNGFPAQSFARPGYTNPV